MYTRASFIFYEIERYVRIDTVPLKTCLGYCNPGLQDQLSITSLRPQVFLALEKLNYRSWIKGNFGIFAYPLGHSLFSKERQSLITSPRPWAFIHHSATQPTQLLTCFLFKPKPNTSVSFSPG